MYEAVEYRHRIVIDANLGFLKKAQRIDWEEQCWSWEDDEEEEQQPVEADEGLSE